MHYTGILHPPLQLLSRRFHKALPKSLPKSLNNIILLLLLPVLFFLRDLPNTGLFSKPVPADFLPARPGWSFQGRTMPALRWMRLYPEPAPPLCRRSAKAPLPAAMRAYAFSSCILFHLVIPPVLQFQCYMRYPNRGNKAYIRQAS